MAAECDAAISTVKQWLAPGATAIWLRPSASTMMSAVPVAASPETRRPSTPMPAAARLSPMRRPSASSPTQPIILTSPPRRRAAIAWLAPLPPRLTRRVPPETVSPGDGRRGSATV